MVVKKEKSRMKLFVWTDFCRKYTEGLAFAIAEDETEAKKLVEENRGYEIHSWGKLEVHSLEKIARSVDGGE